MLLKAQSGSQGLEIHLPIDEVNKFELDLNTFSRSHEAVSVRVLPKTFALFFYKPKEEARPDQRIRSSPTLKSGESLGVITNNFIRGDIARSRLSANPIRWLILTGMFRPLHEIY